MWEILKLVRFRTIAFAAATMYAMRYFVISPILRLNGFELQMSGFSFALLVLAVCSLISGAYVINDYFDTKADRISGVRDIIVGKSISRRTAIFLHTGLNIFAILITFYLGFLVGVWKIGILFMLASGLLWFYSSYYKRYFIIGNLIVGLLAALIPVSVIMYEIPLLNTAYSEILVNNEMNFIYMFDWILGFSFFIFINTLMYEINKDLYSVDGDMENEIKTIPVELGTKTARYVIAGLAALCVATLTTLYCTLFISSLLILVYFIVVLFIPYLVYMVSILRSRNRRFQLKLIRLILVLCVGFSLLLNYFLKITFA